MSRVLGLDEEAVEREHVLESRGDLARVTQHRGGAPAPSARVSPLLAAAVDLVALDRAEAQQLLALANIGVGGRADLECLLAELSVRVPDEAARAQTHERRDHEEEVHVCFAQWPDAPEHHAQRQQSGTNVEEEGVLLGGRGARGRCALLVVEALQTTKVFAARSKKKGGQQHR